MHRENVMGEPVEEAYDNQDQGIRNHHDFITEPVDNPADQWSSEECTDGGNSKQDADDHGVCTVKQHKYVWTEGEKNLFACAIEYFQHVKFRILFSEIETLPGMIGFTVSF